MSQSARSFLARAPLAFFTGGGEMGERTRAFDWSQTALGPLAGWPQSLKIAVRIMLDSRYAMWLGWGPTLTFFYNDAYAHMTLGPKHPWALGRSAREVWSEIWDDIGPRAKSVVDTGQATWDEGLLLFLERRGFPEETYHTFSYSPLPKDDGGVGGMLCVVTEDTERTIGERRLRTLRELATRTNEEPTSAKEACETAARTLAENPRDLPFVLIYLLDAEGKTARLAGLAGLVEGTSAAPRTVDLGGADSDHVDWPLRGVLRSGRAEVVTDLAARFGSLPGSVWPEPPAQAVVLPLAKPGQARLAGFVVAGASPRLALDDGYKGFLDLLAGQVATAVTNAQAYEEERKRAESLAELDRAKTVFFSNVSHEFRTPLTLLLGPVEDALAETEDDKQRERLEVAHRNGLRLQKLVNTLLDFSRMEAGRLKANYLATDLAALTASLASNFRSACERAGLDLVVDCPPLSQPVYVDHEMWEKIVLNLLSNAFKFTLEGQISVALCERAGKVILSVRDTGTGIPADQMPQLFERFYRVEGTQGRTLEGTGIGLALVKELAHQHGGEVQAESELGKGSVFTVTLPLGTSHLPAERIGADSTLASTTLGTASYIEEALRWLLVDEKNGTGQSTTRTKDFTPQPGPGARPRILLADDNADMRDYITRLLAVSYDVQSVRDGQNALAAARHQLPDLILTDVMMPGLDGFGLLQALRGDPSTSAVPILLLSARAGEEARVEGLRAGADDYLTKPFSARELLARVQAHLALARIRRESSEALQRSEWFHRLIAELTSDFTFSLRFDAGGATVEFLSPGFKAVTGFSLEELNARGGWPTVIHAEDLPLAQKTIERMRAGEEDESEVRLLAKDGRIEWVRYLTHPVVNSEGQVTGFIGAAQHITDRKNARDALREASDTLRSFYQTAPIMMGVVEVDADKDDVLHLTDNAATGRFFGVDATRLSRRRASEMGVPPDHLREWVRHYRESERSGQPARFEYRHDTPEGTRWLSAIVYCIGRLPAGRFRCSYVAEDVTERKRTEEALRKNSDRLRLLWEAATVLLTTEDPDAMLRNLFGKIAPHFDLDAYFNFLVDESGEGLSLGSCAGIPKDEADKITWLPFGQAVCGTVALRRQAIVATHIQESNEPMVQMVKGYGIRAYACNPLQVDGRLLGTLSFASRTRDDFAPDELEFLGTISHYVTVAYERLRLVRQLREQDRRKDEFLATLAHELRNPLAPIRNSLQILKMPRIDQETAERSRAMMERQVHHLIRLVDDLLDVSRVLRGKIELRRERVELATVVARAVETAQPLMEAQEHELTVRLPPESLLMEADPVRMAQVIGNLLTNAAKYTELHGRIRLTAQREHGEAVVRIQDNGIGIAPEMLSKIFDLFVQVDDAGASTRAQGGLGIGLTLVKNLVTMHHGTVEAHSDGLGRGSEFVVRLPLAPRARPESPGPDAGQKAPTASPHSHRLLVVDDNRDAANSLAVLLRLQGHEVRVAHDGPAALELVKVYRPELVFLDIGMPGMDGYEVARRLRSQPGLEKVRLAALTGWGQNEDRRRTAKAGFDHHLVKPPELSVIDGLLSDLKRP